MNICQTRCTQQTFLKTTAVISVVTAIALAVIASTAVAGIASTILYATGGVLGAAVLAGLIIKGLRPSVPSFEYESPYTPPGATEAVHCSPQQFTESFEQGSRPNQYRVKVFSHGTTDYYLTLQLHCREPVNAAFLLSLKNRLALRFQSIDLEPSSANNGNFRSTVTPFLRNILTLEGDQCRGKICAFDFHTYQGRSQNPRLDQKFP